MSDPKISLDIIRKVAKLARLKLTAPEEELYLQQLGPILEHIDNLNKIDTTNVFPTYQVIDRQNIFQVDNVRTLSQSSALSSAPKTSQGFIVTPESISK